jgi:hypothetical protein
VATCFGGDTGPNYGAEAPAFSLELKLLPWPVGQLLVARVTEMFFVLGENVEEYAGVFFRSGVLVDRVLSACCFGVTLLDGLRSSTYSHFPC